MEETVPVPLTPAPAVYYVYPQAAILAAVIVSLFTLPLEQLQKPAGINNDPNRDDD